MKSISSRLAEFSCNRVLQRPHTRTCTILQKAINRFFCSFIVFLKSKTHQLNLKDVIELNRNLRLTNGDKIPDKIVAGWYECKTIQFITVIWYWPKNLLLIRVVFD